MAPDRSKWSSKRLGWLEVCQNIIRIEISLSSLTHDDVRIVFHVVISKQEALFNNGHLQENQNSEKPSSNAVKEDTMFDVTCVMKFLDLGQNRGQPQPLLEKNRC